MQLHLEAGYENCAHSSDPKSDGEKLEARRCVHGIELKARASRDLCTEAFWFIFLFFRSNFASRSPTKAFSSALFVILRQ